MCGSETLIVVNDCLLFYLQPDATRGHEARIESMGEAMGSPEVHHSAQEASLNDEPA